MIMNIVFLLLVYHEEADEIFIRVNGLHLNQGVENTVLRVIRLHFPSTMDISQRHIEVIHAMVVEIDPREDAVDSVGLIQVALKGRDHLEDILAGA